jgi:hypothetical protein
VWIPKLLASGRWTCENTETRDLNDKDFDTQDEAAAYANECNSLYAKDVAERKAKAAQRKAAREAAQANFPTQALTSRGDGWEGTGSA